MQPSARRVPSGLQLLPRLKAEPVHESPASPAMRDTAKEARLFPAPSGKTVGPGRGVGAGAWECIKGSESYQLLSGLRQATHKPLKRPCLQSPPTGP